jgi:hypothetical protein
VFCPIQVGEMYRFALSVVELRFGAFYWVGIAAEISPDGEIAARFNLNAREMEYLHPCGALLSAC